MKKKNLFRNTALAFAAFATMAVMESCSNSGSVISSGNLEYEQDELKPQPFTAIDIDAVADVYYTQNNGDKHQVQLDFSLFQDEETAQQFREKTKVVYRDGKVIVGMKGKINGSKSLKQGQRLRVLITSPDLVKVDNEGVGSFNANAINSDSFTLDNEGVGNVNIKSLLANKITIDNEGVGNVTIGKMQSDKLYIDNEGVGNVKIASYKGGDLTIDNEGVGNVEAHVDCTSIKATLEGVGSIKLSGTTRSLSKKKEGVGSLKTSDLKVVR